MDYNINEIISIVNKAKFVFPKRITANDAGVTGAHQAGFHLPKSSWKLFFDTPGVKGTNKDRIINITWNKSFVTESRIIYYGVGTRNEYRLTRFGLGFPYLKTENVGELLIIIRNQDDTYEGFVIKPGDIHYFLEQTNIDESQINSIIIKDLSLMKNGQMSLFDVDIDERTDTPAAFEEIEEEQEDEIEGLNTESKKKYFNPKAHILTLLGDELIKSPVMAIYELVKNAYDADAMKVDVYFNDIENRGEASIIIEDDGTGMTSDVVENVWLEPGTDYRKPVDPETGKRRIVKSPLYCRVPMGEKGVGRFAVHKLGNKILLITRPLLIEYNEDGSVKSCVLADYEIQLYINWTDFSQSRHLSDIPITWKIKRDQSTFRFKVKSGTYIRLSDLKEKWTQGMARDLKASTISMLSPKMETDKFKISLKFNNQWLSETSSLTTFLEEAPYKFKLSIDENLDMKLEYHFELKHNPVIGSRTIEKDEKYDKNIKGDLRPFIRRNFEKQGYSQKEIERLLDEFIAALDRSPFGSLLFEFYSYDLDTASLRDYSSDSKITRGLLKEHSGIKVFKGDLRVFDYGEKGNDWLGIDLERIQNKEWFSNNQNIGYVHLDPEKSEGLVEKTNREGFIHNDVYMLFEVVLKYILTEIKNIRQTDRQRWLNYNRRVTEKSFGSRVASFKMLIEDSDIEDEGKKKRIIEEAEKLQVQYEEDTKILLLPAGVGMTASVALHEIEKLVPRMAETVKFNPVNREIITEQVEELKIYTEGIISILRKGGTENVDVGKAIQRAVTNYRLKLQDRKIKVEYDIDKNVDTIMVEGRLLITVLMNLIDNSIYWLDTVLKDRKILIKAFKDKNNITSIIMADNGPGFKDSIVEVVTPFFSRKVNGIGIGLYLIDTIMMKYGKFDIINEYEMDEYSIPEGYRGGAIVKLMFNKI